MTIGKLRLILIIIMVLVCFLAVGIGFITYFFSTINHSSPSPTPSPPTPSPTPSPSPSPSPSSFSVKITDIYGFFLEDLEDDSRSVYGCYELGENPNIDTSDETNYIITLDITYYPAEVAGPNGPPPSPPQAQIGMTSGALPSPSLRTNVQAEINVNPNDNISDQPLSVTLYGYDVDLIRYSLNDGVLTINYNLEMSDKSVSGNNFPFFDTSTMVAQFATAPDCGYIYDASMCTCGVKAIDNSYPGFVLLTLTISYTLTFPLPDATPVQGNDDYQVLIFSAFIDSSVQELSIFYGYPTIPGDTGPPNMGISFSITLSKTDDSKTITFGNKILIELSPLTPDPTQVCPSSRMVSSESNTRRRKTLRSSFSVQESAPACDLC